MDFDWTAYYRRLEAAASRANELRSRARTRPQQDLCRRIARHLDKARTQTETAVISGPKTREHALDSALRHLAKAEAYLETGEGTMKAIADAFAQEPDPDPQERLDAVPECARLTEMLRLVAVERKRQDAKWGRQAHPIGYWLAILVEEVGELAKVVVDWASFGERRSMTAAETEAVQVAAVAVAMVEHLRQLAEEPELEP